MAIPKKKSRIITVENVDYRWIISARNKGTLNLVVEQEFSQGQLLEVTIESDINEYWIEFPNIETLNLRVIKPGDVEFIIKQAILLVWKSKEQMEKAKFKLIGSKIIRA